MRATTAAQQLAATGGGPAAAEQELLGWPALTAAAGGGGASAAPAAPPERCLSLARQPTPLLPCGLTAQELAALTAQRASSGGAPGDAGGRRAAGRWHEHPSPEAALTPPNLPSLPQMQGAPLSLRARRAAALSG